MCQLPLLTQYVPAVHQLAVRFNDFGQPREEDVFSTEFDLEGEGGAAVSTQNASW